MSLVVTCGTDDLAHAAARKYLLDFDIVSATDLDIAHHPRVSGARVIVACADTIGNEEIAAIRDIVRAFPLAQVLILTKVTAGTLRLASEIPGIVDHIVEISDAATILPARVRGLVDAHYLDLAAKRLAGFTELSGVVKLFLKRAWRRRPPPTSVSQVSREVGVHLSTLRDHWPFDEPPKAFLDWALLIGAVFERQRGASWPMAAARVGLTSRRLDRIAARRLGSPLRTLDEKGAAWIERQFHAWLSSTYSDTDLTGQSA